MKRKIYGVLATLGIMCSIISLPQTNLQVKAAEQNGITVSSDNVYVMPGQTMSVSCALGEVTMDATRLTYTVSSTEYASVIWAGAQNNIAALQISYVADGQTVIAVYNQDDMSMIAYITVTTSTYAQVNKEGIQIKHTGQIHDEKGATATIQNITVTKNFEGDYDEIKVTASWDGEDGSLYNMFPFATFYDAKGNILKRQVDVIGGLAVGENFTARWFIPEHTASILLE